MTVEDAHLLIQVWGVLDELAPGQPVETVVNNGRVTLTGTVADPDLSAELSDRIGEIEGVEALELRLTLTTDVVERRGSVARRLQRQTDWLIGALPLLAVSLSIWALTSWLGYLVAARRWPWDRMPPTRSSPMSCAWRSGSRRLQPVRSSHWTFWAHGHCLARCLGAAGILGLAVGIAVCDVVENFLASILLSLRSPFRPNDLIELAGDTGRVVRLTARATSLISPDGNQIRIPNATVFKARIVNYSRRPERCFNLRLPLSPGTEIAPAIARAQAALRLAPFVLESPAPSVWLTEIAADGGATLEAAAWIGATATGFATARGEALRQIVQSLSGEKSTPLPRSPERTQDAAIEDIADAEARHGEQLLNRQTRDE